MVFEVVRYNLKPGVTEEFIKALSGALHYLTDAKGCKGAWIMRQVEDPTKVVLQVQWQALEDHLEGFRNSPAYQTFREACSSYFAGPADLVHYQAVG